MAPNKIAVEEVLIFFVVQISQVSISIVKDCAIAVPKNILFGSRKCRFQRKTFTKVGNN